MPDLAAVFDGEPESLELFLHGCGFDGQACEALYILVVKFYPVAPLWGVADDSGV